MITLCILFVVIQSQITGGFTFIESNEIQHEDNNFEDNFLSSLLKTSHKKLSLYLNDCIIPKKDRNCYISIAGVCLYCKSINENDKKTKYQWMQKEESMSEPDSSRRLASATNKIYSNDSLTVPRTQADDEHDSQQDILSQSTEPSVHVIEDDEKMSDKNDDSRGKIVRNILFIILSGIVIVTFGIFCIVGAHWFSYDKMARRNRRRAAREDGHAGHGLRSSTVVTVSSSYHRLGLGNYPSTYDEAVDTEDAPTTTTTTIKKSPPPLDDPPPPSYDECMSFVHTRPRTYWHTSV